MKKIILSAAALTLLFGACKKDDDTESRHDMLVGTWKVTDLGVDANDNSVLDNGETASITGTGISLTVLFNNDGTGRTIGDFGGGPDTSDINWSLLNSDNTIRVIDGTDTSNVAIYSLDESKLTILDTESDTIGNWQILQKQ